MYRRYSATITLCVMMVLGLALLSASASAQEQADQDFVNQVRELEAWRGELEKQRLKLERERHNLEQRFQELESVSKVFVLEHIVYQAVPGSVVDKVIQRHHHTS